MLLFSSKGVGFWALCLRRRDLAYTHCIARGWRHHRALISQLLPAYDVIDDVRVLHIGDYSGARLISNQKRRPATGRMQHTWVLNCMCWIGALELATVGGISGSRIVARLSARLHARLCRGSGLERCETKQSWYNTYSLCRRFTHAKTLINRIRLGPATVTIDATRAT